MSDDIRLEINAQDMIDRFGRRIPELTREKVMDAMRVFMGKLDAKVVENIEQVFTGGHSVTRSSHTHLQDSLLATVEADGDLVVGRLSIDLETTPYARILELGGVISPHRIMPRAASAMAIPISTFSSGEAYEGAEVTPEGLFVLAFQANHPGASIHPYHYMIGALIEMSKEYENDMSLALASILASA